MELYFSFFPKGWGWFDESKINKVNVLVRNLTDLKDKKLGDDLIAINELLTGSMQEITSKNLQESTATPIKTSYLDKYLTKIFNESISITKPQYIEAEDNLFPDSPLQPSN